MTASAPVSVLLINLGSPLKPEKAEVREYLKEFLSDPRIIEVSPWIWKPILYGIILNTRPAKSAAKYKTIWTEKGSPLLVHTANLASELQEEIRREFPNVRVDWAMRYGQPSIASVMNKLSEEGVEKVLVVPMYPQYSATTTASVMDGVCAALGKMRAQPGIRVLRDYHDSDPYIKALADSIRAHWKEKGPLPANGRLFLSFHGMPQSYCDKGDPYPAQCEKTRDLLCKELGLSNGQVCMGYQSRFGKEEWLKPYTAPTAAELAKQGVERLDILCPGFAADCLETLEEIDGEVREDFLKAGGKEFHYIPCLNDSEAWVKNFKEIIAPHLSGF